jgi:uncharacterized protein
MEWCSYNYLYFSKEAKAYLLYSSLSNKLVQLNEELYNKIIKFRETGNFSDFDNDESKFLLDGRFIVQSNESELNKVILSTLQQRYNTKSMSLTLAPTRFCNFACPYCYEKDRVNKVMSKKVQEKVVDFVKKNKAIESLNVVWYGGEPTLAINPIKYLSMELQKAVKYYSAFMVTNGFYLNKIIDSIKELKINTLQITLDGTKETHDMTRRLTCGSEGGTYDKIMSNIDNCLSKCNIRISIRMNINKTNSDQYACLYRELKTLYGNKVNLYPAFVHDYGGNCLDTCYDNSSKKAEFLKELYEKEKIFTNYFYPLRKSKGCMSQSLNSFVIGPEGEMYKCWHHLGEKSKEVGNLLKPEIITNYTLLSDMMIKNDVIFDNKCKSCVLFPSCDGGCVDHKMENSDYCIPAISKIEDFLDIYYSMKKGKNIPPIQT